MEHLILVLVHLLAALVFIGAVVFEVLFLSSARHHLPHDTMRTVERAVGNRAATVMPWVLLALYGSGLAMAWRYRALLLPPQGHFGWLLALKVLLALSVLAHFLIAMRWRRSGRLDGRRSRFLHRSVLCHMVAIVFLAKAMFHG